jgi:hypothetical protein
MDSQANPSDGASADTGSRDGGSAADASAEASDDGGKNGAPSTTYPAFTVDMPQIVSNQNVVIANPTIVTVTWPASYTNSATWEAFDDAIGASDYWSGVSEYGVGAATSAKADHVELTQSLPSSLGYYDLENFVILALGGTITEADGGMMTGTADPAWPQPTATDGGVETSTLYALYIPGNVSVTDPGSGMDFCTEGGLGYHDDVVVNGKQVAFTVTLECSSQTLPDQEETAAHELVEAATNPFNAAINLEGWNGFDANHLGWTLYTGTLGNEIADACQAWQDSYYANTGSFPYSVQRYWSNIHAIAGHDPCVPVPTGAYYGMTLFPSQESSVSLDLSSAGIGTGPMTALAFKAPVGTPVTFQVGFYSDAAESPWTISYDVPTTDGLYDDMGNPLQNGTATVTIDKTTGQNGEKANVTVTSTKAGSLGFQVMSITWDAPTGPMASAFLPHYQPIVLAN